MPDVLSDVHSNLGLWLNGECINILSELYPASSLTLTPGDNDANTGKK